jgi:hypothetical protein
MRVQILVLGCLLPFLALAGQDRLKYMDYEVTRAQAQAAGARLAIAGRELDSFLGSEAARNFDSGGDELPPEVKSILKRAGIDTENSDGLDEDTKALAAIGAVMFKVCDSENSALLQLRKAWAGRLFELLMLSMGADLKAELSPTVLRQIRAELLPIAQAYFDSWLATAALKVNCAPQALRYADFALADSTNAFADGILGMTRSGLLLDTANGSEGQILAALQVRRKSLSAITREAKLLILKLQKWDPDFKGDSSEEVAETFDLVAQYDDEFTRLTTQTQSPIWRVGATAAPKISTIGRWRCGTPAAMADIFLAFAAPSWPNATAVLKARDANQLLAAYALARWFETENQISVTNRERFWLEESSTTNDVWQAYGKAETQAEFERAANTITLSAPENGLAIVKLFGHEFLLASGEHNSQEPSQPTRWFTLAEIQANFRSSYVFKALTDQK